MISARIIGREKTAMFAVAVGWGAYVISARVIGLARIVMCAAMGGWGVFAKCAGNNGLEIIAMYGKLRKKIRKRLARTERTTTETRMWIALTSIAMTPRSAKVYPKTPLSPVPTASTMIQMAT